MTEYVVLKEIAHDEVGNALDPVMWQYHTTVSAPSAEEAARKVGEEGTFSPVPTRSWNLYTITTETKPRLKVTRKGSSEEL